MSLPQRFREVSSAVNASDCAIDAKLTGRTLEIRAVSCLRCLAARPG